MRPVNIFRVSRIQDERLFNIMEKHEAGDHDDHRIRVHEIDSLRILTDALAENGVTVKDADGFYFGFVIPLIGKEFDLLKVTGKYCLNIELKSQDVSEEAIHAQLKKNRHYLRLLGREMLLFTVVTDTMRCYRLSDEGELEKTDIGEVAWAVKKLRAAYHGRIDKLFLASEYLISPSEDAEKFLQKQYFLTPAQDQVKSAFLKDIEEASGCNFFHISGRPGTGKTLLVYDLAKHMARSGKTLVTCREEPAGGLITISDSLENLDFMFIGDITSADQLKDYEYMFVDEALKLDPKTFDIIKTSAETNGHSCIFSTDPAAELTESEKKNDIEGRIKSLSLAGEYELSERLRLNMELDTFIRKLKRLSYESEKTYGFEHVSINYANNAEEARGLISYFCENGYVFINGHGRSEEPFAEFDECFSHQHISGREYGRVVLLLDSSFSYDKEGYLKGIPAFDPEHPYPNIFNSVITRVRENLALVILDAPELLDQVLSIID